MAENKTDLYKIHLTKGKEGNVYGGINFFANAFYGTDAVAKTATFEKNGTKSSVLRLTSSYALDESMSKRMDYLFGAKLPKEGWLPVDVNVYSNFENRFDNVTFAKGDRIIAFVTSAKIDTFDKKDGTKGQKLVCNCFDYEKIGKGEGTASTPVSVATSAATSDVELNLTSDDLPF